MATQPKGVASMPAAAKSDADCIESAYESALGDLFEQLLNNLTGLPDGPGDQRYVAKFTTGYNAAKHAKELALGLSGLPGRRSPPQLRRREAFPNEGPARQDGFHIDGPESESLCL
jgi:hypothetical protein